MTFRLIAGPYVIEKRDRVLQIAEQVSELCRSLGIDYVFKASFVKENRRFGNSIRKTCPYPLPHDTANPINLCVLK